MASATLLEAMPPFLVGGSMIRKVGLTGARWAEVPAKFEAGTPAVGDAIGLGVAIDYLTNLGMDRVLRPRASDRRATPWSALTEIPALRLYRPQRTRRIRGGVVVLHPGRHPPARRRQILDGENVAVRAGHHCAQPLMPASAWSLPPAPASTSTTTEDDIDALTSAVRATQTLFAG